MASTRRISATAISVDEKKLRVATCEKCGARFYPQSLLAPHLSRHRRRQRWLHAEIRKLRDTFSRMRDIA